MGIDNCCVTPTQHEEDGAIIQGDHNHKHNSSSETAAIKVLTQNKEHNKRL